MSTYCAFLRYTAWWTMLCVLGGALYIAITADPPLWQLDGVPYEMIDGPR